ncbi:MAG: hypothetical protein ABIY55_27115 [Kofleriaceae bacterium]
MKLSHAILLVTAGCNYSFHSGLSTSGGSTPAPVELAAAQSGPAAQGSPTAPRDAGAPRDVPTPPGWPSMPAPAVPSPAPKLTIVSPALDEERVGRQTRSADDRFSNLDCLQDAKKFTFSLAAENWTVKPGGKGILLVVDGVYATVVHDLSKPVRLADLEPYERDSFANTATFAVQYPMYTCGQHWAAVMPTAADGRMLPVAPVVTWWTNTSADSPNRDEEQGRREFRLSMSLPVVNWPLLGTPYFGRTWSQTETERRSGRVVADPEHVVLDWAMARGTNHEACDLTIAQQDDQQSWTDETPLPVRGTVALPAAFVGNALVIDASKCGGISPYMAKLWAKAPSAPPKDKWPVPGGAQAEDYWHSDEGHAQLSRSLENSGSHAGGGGGGGGKCKSQCRLDAGNCRTSCQGAKCANDCGKVERSCKASC